jgi:hypothetical protein
MKTLLKFIAPLLLVLLCEALFRAGVYEALVKPDSHAGSGVRVKRALQDPSMRKLDFVTLGSSRPVYGIDHEALAALAREQGLLHVNLSMPGSHWLTIDAVTGWLARHRPALRGGILAMDLTTFMYPGNGSYELGIAAPFRSFADDAQVGVHVPFELKDMSTWGTHSALYQYREDIQDLIRHPRDRYGALVWWGQRPAADILLHNPQEARDMCAFGVDSVADCDKVDKSDDPAAAGLRQQCSLLRSTLAGRPDFTALARQQPLPEYMSRARDAVRTRLRTLHWQSKPVVLLMPLTGAWKEASPQGLHEWTLSVLQPLVDDGSIRLIDATDALAGGESCRDYFDFYHQNTQGRARLMQQLLPQLRRLLYGDDARLATP